MENESAENDSETNLSQWLRKCVRRYELDPQNLPGQTRQFLVEISQATGKPIQVVIREALVAYAQQVYPDIVK